MTTNLTPLERFQNKLHLTNAGCIEFQGAIDNGGYGLFWYSGGNKYAHRMAWFFEHGEPPKDKLVLHKCDNRACVNVEHLFLGTYQDNTDDMLAKGRKPTCFGEDGPNTKITKAVALGIKQEIAVESSNTKIAAKYNTTRGIVKNIRRGLAWRWLDGTNG